MADVSKLTYMIDVFSIKNTIIRYLFVTFLAFAFSLIHYICLLLYIIDDSVSYLRSVLFCIRRGDVAFYCGA